LKVGNDRARADSFERKYLKQREEFAALRARVTELEADNERLRLDARLELPVGAGAAAVDAAERLSEVATLRSRVRELEAARSGVRGTCTTCHSPVVLGQPCRECAATAGTEEVAELRELLEEVVNSEDYHNDRCVSVWGVIGESLSRRVCEKIGYHPDHLCRTSGG
jgi:BMFP domain-containing protein YqiC